VQCIKSLTFEIIILFNIVIQLFRNIWTNESSWNKSENSFNWLS